MKMRANRKIVFGAAVVAAAALPLAGSLLSAQTSSAEGAKSPPPPKSIEDAKANGGFGHINFETHVGSFKLQGTDETFVTGALQMNFSGTVLISGVRPGTQVTVTGNVRKEYETEDKQRQVYFGTGKVVVLGQLRALQFFGRELSGRFDGVGIFHFYGEFDKNLETGFYWNDGQDAQHRTPWNTGGGSVPVPDPGRAVERPRVRVNTTGG